MGDPYHAWVAQQAALWEQGRRLPAAPALSAPVPPPGGAAPILLFSPHPDDECLTGALPRRFRRESGRLVVNVAVTLGSRPERQAGRWAECQAACGRLGFLPRRLRDVPVPPLRPGLRHARPEAWQELVGAAAAVLTEWRPAAVFFPHARDAHPAHAATHFLLRDALRAMPPDFACAVAETEFWSTLAGPNLLVELKAGDLADLLAAAACHAGEVRRHPYHLRLPAWMQDSVRRGAELVGDPAAPVPDWPFGELYRWSRWQAGQLRPAFDGGRLYAAGDDPSGLLAGPGQPASVNTAAPKAGRMSPSNEP